MNLFKPEKDKHTAFHKESIYYLYAFQHFHAQLTYIVLCGVWVVTQYA